MTFETNPTCPYCGHEVDNSDHDLWEYEGEGNDFECPNCEKDLVLNVQVTTEYELKRPECCDDEHEFEEWVRMDIDQNTLDRWAKDPVMSRHIKCNEKPYSWYSRECDHCDHAEYSINYALGQEVPQDEIEKR